jgi:hypothetical protein
MVRHGPLASWACMHSRKAWHGLGWSSMRRAGAFRIRLPSKRCETSETRPSVRLRVQESGVIKPHSQLVAKRSEGKHAGMHAIVDERGEREAQSHCKHQCITRTQHTGRKKMLRRRMRAYKDGRTEIRFDSFVLVEIWRFIYMWPREHKGQGACWAGCSCVIE